MKKSKSRKTEKSQTKHQNHDWIITGSVCKWNITRKTSEIQKSEKVKKIKNQKKRKKHKNWKSSEKAEIEEKQIKCSGDNETRDIPAISAHVNLTNRNGQKTVEKNAGKTEGNVKLLCSDQE